MADRGRGPGATASGTAGKMTTAEAASPPLRRGRQWPLVATNLSLAVALSGVVMAAIYTRIPYQLAISTDIVGYPTFFNFNIERIVDLYYLVVVLFPILALLIYVALGKATAQLGGSGRRPRLSIWPPPPATTARPERDDRTTANVRVGAPAVGRLLAVGTLFGLEASIVSGHAKWTFWLIAGGTALAYSLIVLSITWPFRLLDRDQARSTNLARVNALAAPLSLIGLLWISQVTSVTVQSNEVVRYYAWLPSWVAASGTALAVACVARALARTRSDDDVREVERRTVLLITGPVFLFVLISVLPGALGPMDMFHEGEQLVGSRLLLDGFMPWRDFMSTHGLLADSLVPAVGAQLFGNSRWGVTAGSRAVLEPLLSIPLYLFAVRLFRRNWLFVLLVGVAIAGNQLAPFLDARFKFWPLVLLLLGLALDDPAWWRSALLGAVLIAQTVVIPEAAFCIPACGLILILRDSYHRIGGSLVTSFSRSLWCTVGGAVLAAAFGVYLLTQHALGDFLFYFVAFAPGHELAGGLPIPLDRRPLFLYAAIGPMVAILLAWLYLVASVLRRRALQTIDWIMGAAGLFTMLYYPKFVERMEIVHAIQVCAAAMPLILLVTYRLIDLGDRALRCSVWRSWPSRNISQRPLTCAVLIAALITFPGSIASRLQNLPQQVRPEVAEEPWLAQIGYGSNALDPATYADLASVFHAYLRPGDWVFDFSNAPGLYYYVLGLTPHTRYYHVSMALSERAQEDLIGELRRNRPRLVVFTNDRFGQPGWDNVPNMVRHYDVSQYILDHYRPLLSIDGQIVYAAEAAELPSPESLNLQLSHPAITKDLPFLGQGCDWGYAPNFLSVSPAGASHDLSTIKLSVTDASSGIRGRAHWLELAPPPGHSWSEYRWLQIETNQGFLEDNWELSSLPSIDQQLHAHVTFKTLGSSQRTYRLYVGNCAQWHGYPNAALYIGHDQPQDIVAVKLLP